MRSSNMLRLFYDSRAGDADEKYGTNKGASFGLFGNSMSSMKCHIPCHVVVNGHFCSSRHNYMTDAKCELHSQAHGPTLGMQYVVFGKDRIWRGLVWYGTYWL